MRVPTQYLYILIWHICLHINYLGWQRVDLIVSTVNCLSLVLATTQREAVVADMTSPSTETSHWVIMETFSSMLASQTTEMNRRMVRNPMEKLRSWAAVYSEWDGMAYLTWSFLPRQLVPPASCWWEITEMAPWFSASGATCRVPGQTTTLFLLRASTFFLKYWVTRSEKTRR